MAVGGADKHPDPAVGQFKHARLLQAVPVVFKGRQQNMDMVWHDYIAIYRDIIIEIVQLIDISCHNRSIWQQLYLRTVQEAGPYTKITICGLLHWGISWF